MLDELNNGSDLVVANALIVIVAAVNFWQEIAGKMMNMIVIDSSMILLQDILWLKRSEILCNQYTNSRMVFVLGIQIIQ